LILAFIITYISNAVQILVNFFWQRSNLSSQFSLNLEHVVLVIVSDKVDCQTITTKPATSTNPVKISFRIPGVVKVNNDVDGHNVDTSSEEISADKASRVSILEIMVNPAKKL
jgi:hypothetical protein